MDGSWHSSIKTESLWTNTKRVQTAGMFDFEYVYICVVSELDQISFE